MPSWKPNGWHSVTTCLVVPDTAAYIRFLREVFDADGDMAEDRPAEMRIGDSILFVTAAGTRPPTSSVLHLYVPSVDMTFRRAVNAGAAVVEQPWNTAGGDRRAVFTDPSGNDWQIAMRR